jgi:hypothetical protein
MENIPQEPKKNKAIRLVAATLFLAQTIFLTSKISSAPEPKVTSIIAAIFGVVAIGNIKRLNWSRVPAEFLLAFIALGTSSYFMPMPDEQSVYPFREIANTLPVYMLWLFQVSIWSVFLYMAYIISNSGEYFHKKWWK